MLTISCEVALEIWFRSQYVCASYFSNGCDGFHLHELRFLAGDILGLFCRPWVHTCMSVTCRFKRAQKNLYEFMSLWNLRLKCSQYVNTAHLSCKYQYKCSQEHGEDWRSGPIPEIFATSELVGKSIPHASSCLFINSSHETWNVMNLRIFFDHFGISFQQRFSNEANAFNLL